MQPKSPHWADQAAARLIRERGDRESYVVASGITPSGVVHIGNFREVVTVDLVARALRDLGKKIRFIYSWDDFDTFRKVPINFPNQEMLAKEMRKPICRVPDPFGTETSYAKHNERAFEKELTKVGISPEYIYQNERYSKGVYAEQTRVALEQRAKIEKILNDFRTEPLEDGWLPTAIFCEKCDRDEMDYERYDGEWNYAYKCKSCGHETTTDIRKTKNLKLNWRTDWPMRWNFEKVDFEPGGKDHSSEGGSYDTGARIVKEVWQREPPIYLQYDFVSIKGMDGKMSSSKGNLITLSEALAIYDPQIVRWIFASQRPNHDFSLAFDEDVFKTYDEFDRCEAEAFAEQQGKNGPLNKRIYEFSLVDGKLPETQPYRANFRTLCNRLQVCDGDIERVVERFYQGELRNPKDLHAFRERATNAWYWLEHFAPQEFCYRLNAKPVSVSMGENETKGVAKLKELIKGVDLETIDAKDLNQSIYDQVINAVGLDPKMFFQAVYRKLINRDQGPRLPSFLKEIGRERLLELL